MAGSFAVIGDARFGGPVSPVVVEKCGRTAASWSLRSVTIARTSSPLSCDQRCKEKVPRFTQRTFSSRPLPLRRAGNAQCFPVFGDGAARDLDTAPVQFRGEALVRQRLARVFLGDEFADHRLDRGGRSRAAVVGGDARGKEMLELERAARRVQVLARGDARDGGFV